MKKRYWVPLLTGGLLLGYLLAWPVAIDPASWEPPAAPATDSGVHARNDRLAGVTRLAEGFGIGPEAVAFGSKGDMVTAYEDGRVVRFDADGSNPQVLANTRGRPLGLHVLEDGTVIVADAVEGLLRVEDGYAYPLSVTAGGTPYRFVDDVVVNAAGTMAYFTDASSRFGINEVMADAFEHRPNGRLLAYDLTNDRLQVLADNLYFANGVTLGPDERYLLVTETTRYRVQRYWLKGERAGEIETFIDNLPGFPDNITFDGERFWLALYAPRDPMLDALLSRPFLRKVAFRLPEVLQPGPTRHAYVLALDAEGAVLADLQDIGDDAFAPITSAIVHGDHLYLGSLSANAIGRIPLSALPLFAADAEPEAMPDADAVEKPASFQRDE